jgi:cytochrome d ubiquinol oxidase subunit I
VLATNSWDGQVEGMTELNAQEQQAYGPGNYIPPVRTVYWSMRVMAYLGTLVFLVAVVGAWLYRKRKLETARWFHRAAVLNIASPFVAALAGWALTEAGRQPWIVFGLLRTADANSPSVSTWWLGMSLFVFAALYGALAVVDFVLMRRYARLDPPEVGGEGDEFSVPAVSY